MNPSTDELRSLPVLASLSAAELEDARQYFAVRSYQKNAIVITEGDEIGFSHLILSGSAQAFWRDDVGHQIKLGIDHAWAHFPDSSLAAEPARHGQPCRTCESPALASPTSSCLCSAIRASAK